MFYINEGFELKLTMILDCKKNFHVRLHEI
jgi:hypothetical protein